MELSSHQSATSNMAVPSSPLGGGLHFQMPTQTRKEGGLWPLFMPTISHLFMYVASMHLTRSRTSSSDRSSPLLLLMHQYYLETSTLSQEWLIAPHQHNWMQWLYHALTHCLLPASPTQHLSTPPTSLSTETVATQCDWTGTMPGNLYISPPLSPSFTGSHLHTMVSQITFPPWFIFSHQSPFPEALLFGG